MDVIIWIGPPVLRDPHFWFGLCFHHCLCSFKPFFVLHLITTFFYYYFGTK